ncbi:MAG: hypothetical protein IEMM0006_0999 [bacterium]|nr:MAG: hypothetical protein IEMM0006_0999 [bacterium]
MVLCCISYHVCLPTGKSANFMTARYEKICIYSLVFTELSYWYLIVCNLISKLYAIIHFNRISNDNQ